MNTQQMDKLHSDRSNWKVGIFYSCAQDPRPVVRSGKIGWTMNCAKPLGWVLVVLFFGTIISVGIWMKSQGMSQLSQLGMLEPVIGVWVLVFHILSSASRFARE